MRPERSYLKMPAYLSAMRLARSVYFLTQRFPQPERCDVALALRRGVAAIPSRLAGVFDDADQSDAVLRETQGSIRECLVYLQVARNLHLARRWRFYRPRRCARRLLKRIHQMLEQLEGPAAQPLPLPRTRRRLGRVPRKLQRAA